MPVTDPNDSAVPSRYTRNITEVVRKALRNGGYEDDSTELLHATVLAVGVSSARFCVLAHFVTCTGRVYLELDAHGQWIADF